MALTEELTTKIVNFVKKEPRTIQDISKLIQKSWVTTDSYINKIKDQKGLVNIKSFRAGTQGAIKLVYYNYSDSLITDETKEYLYNSIRNGKRKQDFDFMEIFQYILEKNKKIIVEEAKDESVSDSQEILNLFQKAQNNIYCLSGNLSFINIKKDNIKMYDIIEELLKRKIKLTILSRINIASINNINKLNVLIKKYPDLIEIRHSYQPLRGFIIDNKFAHFKNEEVMTNYRTGELERNTRIYYELWDQEWINWLQKVFWNLFKPSIDYKIRVKEIKQLY